jgi:mediator of RNA polymerase II transcription subunit 17, fungi type
MASSRTLTIPFHAPSDNSARVNQSDLSKKIAQIIDQKGHFRDVTEQSLIHEGSDENDNASDHDVALEATKEDLTPEKRQEKIRASKQTMFAQYQEGFNEVLTILDFVNLLISKQSAPARADMSDILQSSEVKPGSFEPKVIRPPEPLPAKTQQEGEVSVGWRSKGYETASKRFSAASERLKKEAERETSFWAQAAMLIQQGWKISRHPRDAKAMGVHFGLAESAPQFRNRGTALLRQTEDGKVYLDRPTSSETSKRLRITVYRKGRQTGSHVTMIHSPDEELNIKQQVATARDDLINQELFHEMSREARLITNQGVVARTEGISFDIGQDRKVSISYDRPRVEHHRTDEDDQLAYYIHLCVRSLLLGAHRDNLRRRSRTPHPMSTRPIATPEYYILRPLISSLRHSINTKHVISRLRQTLLVPLERAGIIARLEGPHGIDGSSTVDNDSTMLLSVGTVVSCFTLNIPSVEKIDVRIRSYMGQPIYGTSYETARIDFSFARISETTYSDPTLFLEATSRLLLLALVKLTTNTSPSSRTWEVTMAQKGELSLVAKTSRKALLRVRIQAQASTLILKALPAIGEDERRDSTLVWTWNRTGSYVAGDTERIGLDKEKAKLPFAEVISLLSSWTARIT